MNFIATTEALETNPIPLSGPQDETKNVSSPEAIPISQSDILDEGQIASSPEANSVKSHGK